MNEAREDEIQLNWAKHPRRGAKRRSPLTALPRRIPRITRLMALAIKFQDMVNRSEVRDYADLARLGYVSRARITQIMNLLNLAPDIQETLLLDLDSTCSGPITEQGLRRVSRLIIWEEQRRNLDWPKPATRLNPS